MWGRAQRARAALDTGVERARPRTKEHARCRAAAAVGGDMDHSTGAFHPCQNPERPSQPILSVGSSRCESPRELERSGRVSLAPLLARASGTHARQPARIL